MRNLLALVGLAVVVMIGLGWYLEWYKFGSDVGKDGHRTIKVEVDADKIAQDEKKFQQRVTDALNKKDGSGTTPSLPVPPLPPLPPPPPGKNLEVIPASGT